ncbi:hypothetical protein RN001_003418 [Aquatica leii]|uniref:Uncharacterized protein n=1 Tax=Aquatica leii TaxID=1421715 RepID=A0AAN7SKR4_9COLE|nr:hypothetical protein RN001_003418 [Aquatica leii]
MLKFLLLLNVLTLILLKENNAESNVDNPEIKNNQNNGTIVQGSLFTIYCQNGHGYINGRCRKIYKLKNNYGMYISVIKVTVIKILPIAWLLICLNFEIFHGLQNLYVFVHERCDVTFNDSGIYNTTGKCYKLRGNQLYLNISFNLNLTLETMKFIEVAVTGYQFRSNEYRKGPIEFKMEFCDALKRRDFDIPDMFSHSNIKCPLLQIAQQKEKKAETQSDLNSDTDDASAKIRKKIQRVYRSDEKGDEDLSILLNKPTALKKNSDVVNTPPQMTNRMFQSQTPSSSHITEHIDDDLQMRQRNNSFVIALDVFPSPSTTFKSTRQENDDCSEGEPFQLRDTDNYAIVKFRDWLEIFPKAIQWLF